MYDKKMEELRQQLNSLLASESEDKKLIMALSEEIDVLIVESIRQKRKKGNRPVKDAPHFSVDKK